MENIHKKIKRQQEHQYHRSCRIKSEWTIYLKNQIIYSIQGSTEPGIETRPLKKLTNRVTLFLVTNELESFGVVYDKKSKEIATILTLDMTERSYGKEIENVKRTPTDHRRV